MGNRNNMNVPDNLETKMTETAFRSLLRTFGLLRQIMEPFFARFGISGSQWAVLRVLHRAESQGDKGLRLKDIGERLLIQPPSVTGVVDRLERLGLVRRGGSEDDLRVRPVRLTPAGRKLVESIRPFHVEQIKLLFAGLQSEELEQFTELLHKLEAHLGTITPRHPAAEPAHRKPVEV